MLKVLAPGPALSVTPLNVAAPVAPVVAVALVGVAPAGVTVAVTSTPLWLTGLPLASWSWTTGCCANATPLCAVAEGGVVSVSWVAAPCVTGRAGICVSAVPLAVAEIVFPSAFVELKVPVATPLAFVGPVGWVRLLPVPVAARTTVAPLTGLPFPSFAVTVIVVVAPPPAGMVAGAAPTVETLADSAPFVTVTAAVCVSAAPFTVAETVFPSATVELSVPAAARAAVAPGIGLPTWSVAVTVMVGTPLPAVVGGVAAMVDCAADTPSELTATVAVCVTAPPLTVADTVFASATVELSVPVAT